MRLVLLLLLNVIVFRMSAFANDAHHHEAHHEAKSEHAAESHDQAPAKSHEEKAPEKPSKPSLVSLLWQRFLAKLNDLRHLDEDNASLRARVAALELANANLESKHVEHAEEKRAKHLRAEAAEEGGVVASRTVASLKPADEGLLSHPPKAIFDGAVAALNSKDYETAAKAFAHLVESSENDSFQDARTFFLAAVSLYNLSNFKKARTYFEQSAASAAEGDVSYAPRALAWMALCSKKLGDRKGTQHAVHELLQKYPKSKEARRLNRRNDA